MALTDPMGPHFHGGVAPEDARTLGDAIANIYTRTKDTLGVSYAIIAEVSNDPDITQERIAEIVRENQNPVDVEQIKQIVREAAAEDNVELADNIVDRIAGRLVN